MTKLAIPNEYLVDGLEAIHYSKPGDKCEAVQYETPKGTKFSVAKDFMGIQICMSGRFWPPPFSAFQSMEQAVELLRTQTNEAVSFFDEIKMKPDVAGKTPKEKLL